MLDLIMSANSAVVLDIAQCCARTDDKRGIFSARALNSTVIFKLPNFDQEHEEKNGSWEWNLSAQLKGADITNKRPVETGIFIPYSAPQREAGGVVLYVRQRNFEALVQEFLGLNHKYDDQPSLRDKAILAKLDGIPSLDPFLVKLALAREFPEIDLKFYSISESEDLAVRDTITKKVIPIVAKALESSSSKQAPAELFVNAVWNPEAREAALFVSAFGIAASQTVAIFEAWRGISYYEWSHLRLRPLVAKILAWLKSEKSRPIDAARIGPAARKHLADLASSVARGLSAQARSADGFFKDYADKHAKFVDAGDPSGFKEFLSGAPNSYWNLGWQIASLTHVVGIFSKNIARGSDGQVTAEILQSMLGDIGRSLERNVSLPGGEFSSSS